jgi:hypothetical protein
MNKHVLFYSNYCNYSKDVLGMLSAAGSLRDMFVMVCVDRRNIGLPDFVDRVPLVFTLDRRVLVDDAVRGFVKSLSDYVATSMGLNNNMSNITTPAPSATPGNNAGSPPSGAGGGDVSPWSTLEMGSRGISDMFSFLQPGSDETTCYSHNFVDVESNPRIMTPEDDPDGPHNNNNHSNTRSRGGGGGTSLETLQAMRDEEFNKYLPPRPHVV